MLNIRGTRRSAAGAPPTLAGRLWSRERPGGWEGRVWRVLIMAYAVVGIALHVVLGLFFALGYWSDPWWFVTLMMLAWAAVWVPVIRLLRSRPGAVAFVVFAVDIAVLLGAATIADAVGWI